MKFDFEVCDVCGTKLIDFVENQCCGKKCPKCNEKKIVTSYFSVLSSDETLYEIELLPDNDSCLENIKTISKLGNCNFIIAKKLLNNGGILIQDKAINIHDKISELNSLKIKYIVTPNYPHK